MCAYIGGIICISNFKADLLDKLNCGVLGEGSIREYLLDNSKTNKIKKENTPGWREQLKEWWKLRKEITALEIEELKNRTGTERKGK